MGTCTTQKFQQQKQQNAKTICTQNAGGSTQFWQCQYFGCIWSPNPSLIDFVAKRKPQLNKNNLWNRASLPVGCWWKAKKGGWLCTLEHQLAATSWNLAGHTLHCRARRKTEKRRNKKKEKKVNFLTRCCSSMEKNNLLWLAWTYIKN